MIMRKNTIHVSIEKTSKIDVLPSEINPLIYNVKEYFFEKKHDNKFVYFPCFVETLGGRLSNF